MPLTPETLTRHELIGLHARVVESTDSARVGVEGRVVSETMQTLLVSEEPRSSEPASSEGHGPSDHSSGQSPREDGESRERDSGVTRVPKRGTTFEFRLTDEPAVSAKEAGTASEPVSDESHTAGYDAAYVTVDGVELLSRPALRSEQGVDSKWR